MIRKTFVTLCAALLLMLAPVAAQAHYLTVWAPNGKDYGYITSDHGKVGVYDGSCGNPAAARAWVEWGDGTQRVYVDLYCDNLISTTNLYPNPKRIKMCDGNGNCSAWKSV